MAEPLVIKICGIRTEPILEVAIAAGADMVADEFRQELMQPMT